MLRELLIVIGGPAATVFSRRCGSAQPRLTPQVLCESQFSQGLCKKPIARISLTHGQRWEKVAFAQPSYKIALYDNVANIERQRRQELPHGNFLNSQQTAWCPPTVGRSYSTNQRTNGATYATVTRVFFFFSPVSFFCAFRSHFLSKRRCSRNV